MGQNNDNNCCSCLGALIMIIVMGVIMTVVFTKNKIQGNFFVRETGVYSQPIETEGPLAEIIGLAKVLDQPKEERGGWSLVDLHGMSGWVKTASLSHISMGRLGDEDEAITWKGNNTRVGRTQNTSMQAVSTGFLIKFGDRLYPYAESADRLFYYGPDNLPVSFSRSTFPSAPVTKMDEGRTIPFTSEGTQYVINDCSFYYLDTATGRLTNAGVLSSGTPVKLGEPHFPFTGRTPDLRILLGEFQEKSDYPCVIKVSEASITSTKPGTVPAPIRWNPK